MILVCFIFAKSAQAATFFISPVSGEYQAGSKVSVAVKINTENIAVNAVDGAMNFNENILEVSSISKAGSIINLWVQEPSYSNKSGTINFGGIILNPGFKGVGNIFTINFRAKSSGNVGVNFSTGSVLANDGQGTNVLTSTGGGSYLINSIEISPTLKTKSSDSTPPKDFQITRVDNDDPTNPRPELLFESSDDESGINRYEIKIGDGDWFTVRKELASKPYRLPLQAAGSREVGVKAIDNANNITLSKINITIKSIQRPQIKDIIKKTIDNKVKIKGRAATGTKIHIYIYNLDKDLAGNAAILNFNNDNEDKYPIVLGITTNKDGDWEVEVTHLASGSYSIHARTEDDRGAISDPSETVYVEIDEGKGASFISSLKSQFRKLANIQGWIFIILVILLSTVFSVLGHYLPSWFKSLRRRTRKTREVEINTEAIDDRLVNIYKDIKDELQALEKVSNDRKLTYEEKRIQSKLELYSKIIRTFKL